MITFRPRFVLDDERDFQCDGLIAGIRSETHVRVSGLKSFDQRRHAVGFKVHLHRFLGDDNLVDQQVRKVIAFSEEEFLPDCVD